MPDVKREFERKSVHKELDVSFRRLNTNTFIRIHHIADMSYGGMKFYTESRISVNEEIEVRLNLSDYIMRMIVAVRRCSQSEDNLYETGVEFITISGKNLRMLTKVLED